MTVSVLIPYRPDGGRRDDIWAWLSRRYQLLLPEYEVVVCDDLHQQETLNRGQARNLAAEAASGDVFVIGDADTAFNKYDIRAAVASCQERGGWYVPEKYHQLTELYSAHVVSSCPTRQLYGAEADWTGEGTSFAPILVVPAAAFRSVGGYDERYPGWGSDDRSFAIAMETLYRPHHRYPGAAYHLWHPRAELIDTGAGVTLQYVEAYGDKAKLLALREGAIVRGANL